jgi:hypothetical protein
MLDPALAVKKWKQFRGFYAAAGSKHLPLEHRSNQLLNADERGAGFA